MALQANATGAPATIWPNPATPQYAPPTAVDLGITLNGGAFDYVMPGVSTYQPVYRTVPQLRTEYIEAFVRIGQALWTIALAFLGGLIAMGLAVRKAAAAPVKQE